MKKIGNKIVELYLSGHAEGSISSGGQVQGVAVAVAVAAVGGGGQAGMRGIGSVLARGGITGVAPGRVQGRGTIH